MVKDEEQIITAINILKKKYGIVGLNKEYLLATDIDGDLRICAVGLIDKMFYKRGAIISNNFIKIKDLINNKEQSNELQRSEQTAN